MKALVVAPHPFFSPRGTPFSVYYRTLITAQLGVDVDLLTYGEGEDVTIPGVRLIRIPRIPFTRNVPVGPSAKKLVLDVFMAVWTLWLLIRNRYDYVHAHEESVFFCAFYKKLFGFKLVYDMHSSLPQQLSNFKFTKWQFPVRVFEFLETAALRAATAVITICPDLADTVSSKLHDSSAHFLIENSIFDDVALASGERRKLADETLPSLPDTSLVVYTGTFEAYQGIDLLIGAFAKVQEQRSDATLVLVGGTPAQVAQYRVVAESHGLNGSCVFTGRVPPTTARCLSRRASVLTSPRVLGTNAELEAQLSGQAHLQWITLSRVPADVPEPPGASPRPVGRVSASERQAPARHLRTLGGRYDGILVVWGGHSCLRRL